jgi:hypothetical protein
VPRENGWLIKSGRMDVKAVFWIAYSNQHDDWLILILRIAPLLIKGLIDFNFAHLF